MRYFKKWQNSGKHSLIGRESQVAQNSPGDHSEFARSFLSSAISAENRYSRDR